MVETQTEIHLFKFKNPETIKELKRVISESEGIQQHEVDKYLEAAHFRKTGDLLVQATRTLRGFWSQHPAMSLTEFTGLINIALLDIQTRMIKQGEDLMADKLKQPPGTR